MVQENKYIAKELLTITICTSAPYVGFKLITPYIFFLFKA